MLTRTIKEQAMEERHYNKLDSVLKKKLISEEHYHWVWENSERIDATIDWIQRQRFSTNNIAEIGPGGIGLAALQTFPNANIDAYDCTDWFKPVYDQFNIPWNYLNLNTTVDLPLGKYDIILFCEVIEHLAHWPVEIFKNLKASLKPGGFLLVTTQNLHRLSNRLRMVFGKKIFTDFIPDSLVMGHLREYMPEEMTTLMKRAGFTNVKTKFACFPDLESPKTVQKGYSLLCRMSPRLSNHFFCWGNKS